MQSFDTLQERVDDGSLVILNTVSIPRSISTALGRALNESDATSVFVNEPFNRNSQDINTGAEKILDAIAPLLQSGEQPVTVITKSMANYMPSKTFQNMAELSIATIWTVRDPLIQMGSLLTRVANDVAISRGADSITQETLDPYLDEVSAVLENSERSTNFSKTGWASIGEHYRNDPLPSRSIVVDGSDFATDPASVLQKICSQARLNFGPQMIEGWRSGYVNVSNGDNKQTTAESAWTKEASTSVGIIAVSRAALNFSRLPLAIQRHIIEVAVPTYEEMTVPAA